MSASNIKINLIKTLPQSFIESNIEMICEVFLGVSPDDENVSVTFPDEGGFQYAVAGKFNRNPFISETYKKSEEVIEQLNGYFERENDVLAKVLDMPALKFFPVEQLKPVAVNPAYNEAGEIESWKATYAVAIKAFDNPKTKKKETANLVNGGLSVELTANGEIMGMQYYLLPFESELTAQAYKVLNDEENMPPLVYFQNKETNLIAPFYATANDEQYVPATKESLIRFKSPSIKERYLFPFKILQEKSGIRISFVTQAQKDNSITISEMIELLKMEEEKFREVEWNHNKWMVTRLRKIFYGSPAWDRFLIYGVKDIKSSYGDPKKQERGRKRVKMEYFPDSLEFDLVDYEDYPVDENGNKPFIYLKQQDVALEYGSHKGIRIDIGHVLAGLDALNNPNTVYAVLNQFKFGIDRNQDAVTWIGDLGSVLAEVQVKYLNEGKRPLSDNEINEVIYGHNGKDGYAPPQDMLGNIDAYAIHAKYKEELKSTKGSIRVSDILKDYYLGSGTDFQVKRYHHFAIANGINLDSNGNIINKEERIRYFADQIQESAALYIAANSEGFPVTWAFFTAGISLNKFAVELAKSFIRSLEIAIQVE